MQPGRRPWRAALPAGNCDWVKGRRTLALVLNWHGVRCEYIDRVNIRLQQNPFLQLTKLLPSQCAVCRNWPAEPVCSACTKRFAVPALRCTGCAALLPAGLQLQSLPGAQRCMDCIRQPPPLDNTLAAVDYAYPWSALVSTYKFGNQSGWAPFFAGLILKAPGVGQALASLQLSDWVLPVPLSKERLQTRGFNQAWELAKALSEQSGCPARSSSTLLLRVKNTRPQTELKREARLANVKGAFQVDPLRVAELHGKRVVLVDDVLTSGASLFTAAAVLRAAGAGHITGIVLARTPQ